MELKLKLLIRDSLSHIKKQIENLWVWLQEYRQKLKKKGKAHFTILIVPQSEHKTIRWSISYKSITIIISSFFIITFLSALVVLQSSSEAHQIYEFEVSNEDFLAQSQKLRRELNLLHEQNQQYYEKVASLYSKLLGSSKKVFLPVDKESYLPIEPETDIFPETYKLMADLQVLIQANQLIDDIIKIIKQRKKLIQQTPSIWPAKGYILQPFGNFFSSVTGTEYFNAGVDIATTPGAEVSVTAPGTVLEIGYTTHTKYFVKVEHQYGWKTIYSNLDRVTIKTGQELSKGDILGFAAKGRLYPTYMVHYEVHVGANALDPYSFLNQIKE